MSSQRKVLVLCTAVEEEGYFKSTPGNKKLVADGAELKWQTFDSFQEGKRHGTFDAVIAILSTTGADDLEMMEEFYEYYAAAPIFIAFVVLDAGPHIDLLKKWNDKVVIVKCDEENKLEIVTACYAQAIQKYAELYESDVKPAFAEFDKDNSGAIDKAELRELSKKLGNELNDGDLDTALKDLDLNGDGVIDINEFARWYFSGMKSYGSNKRTMLRIKGHATKILEKTKEQAKAAIVGQELKTKSHKFTVGFNDPKENSKAKFSYNLFIGGQGYKDSVNELSGWLNNTMSQSLIDKIADKEIKGEKVFVQFKISTSNAEEKVAHFNELKTKFMEKAQSRGVLIPFDLQIKADGNVISIGFESIVPFNAMPDPIGDFIREEAVVDMINLFKDVDQKICLDFALGTDIKTIFSEEEKETPILKHLASGFRATAQISLVSNLKRAIAEMLKSEIEDEQYIAQKLMIAAPAFLFGINANMDIDFDDFEEIADHPMAAPAMATFEQLFEGLMEDAPESFLTKKMDLSELDQDQVDDYIIINEILDAICDLEDPSFNNVSMKVASANLPVSTDLDIHSESMGSAIKLALKSVFLKKLSQEVAYANRKELDEIYHD